MAITIPKLNIEPEHLHTARRKLQTKTADEKLALSKEEREALLSLISAGKRKIYPTQQALDAYQYNLEQMAKVDPGTHQFDYFTQQIATFQERYCK